MKVKGAPLPEHGICKFLGFAQSTNGQVEITMEKVRQFNAKIISDAQQLLLQRIFLFSTKNRVIEQISFWKPFLFFCSPS